MLRSQSGVYASLLAAAVLVSGASVHAFRWSSADPAGSAQHKPEPAAKAEATASGGEAEPENQRPDLPSWAYAPASPKVTQQPDDGTLLHLPGSGKAYTRTKIDDRYAVPDWFPDTHPAVAHMPARDMVTAGKVVSPEESKEAAEYLRV